MVVKELRTPIRPIIALSEVLAAYPVTKYSKLYSLAMVILSFATVGGLFLDKYLAGYKNDVEVIMNVSIANATNLAPVNPVTTTENPVATEAPTEEIFSQNPNLAETIWYWMENLQNLEDAMLCVILLLGFQSYRNTDINDVFDTIRQGHDRILKLGLTPKYRNWRGIFLLLISLLHAYLIYYSIFIMEKTYFSFTVGKNITASVLPRFISHVYIVQFFCLMELVQDQVQCLTDGLTRENQWYLECLLNIQSHLMNSASCVFDMFMRFVSTCVVHSAIALLLNAYTVTQHSMNFYAILVGFEMLVLIRIIHACGRTQSKVDQFNFELFKLMRKSKHLCDNKKLYLFLTTKQTVSFSAGGFFDLSYSTIVSIVAAATTYLVILVQLSKPKP